jgi:hypothetical protein
MNPTDDLILGSMIIGMLLGWGLGVVSFALIDLGSRPWSAHGAKERGNELR